MQHGGPAFSAQEQEYYHQLFANAAPDGAGFMDSLSARDMLMASGVPRQWLKAIWDISAQGHPGLDARSFCVAMRLVAHAQAGHAPSPELVGVPPQALPDLPLASRERAPSETSMALGVAPSDVASDLQPVLTATEDQVRRAAEAVRLESRRGRSASPAAPRAWSHDQWRPSRRMLRKYAELFLRTDDDGDGFVEGREAAALLERSQLDPSVLAGIRMFADQDRDGGYVWPEFVCLAHMVTALTRGAEMPPELPRELTGALARLEPVHVLAQERQASRSRSASPAPTAHGAHGLGSAGFFGDDALGGGAGFGGADAGFEGGDAGFGGGDAGFGGGDASFGGGDAGFGGDSFGGGDAGFAGDAAFGGGDAEFSGGGGLDFGAGDGGGFDLDRHGGKEKKHKKDKKHKHDEEDMFGASLGNNLRGGDFGGGGFSHVAEDPAQREARLALEEEDRRAREEEAQREARRREEARRQIEEATTRFQAVMAADREIARTLESELAGLEDELRQVQDAGSQLQRQVGELRREGEDIRIRGDDLDSELGGLRRRLAELKEDQRAVNLDSLSLRRDRAHLVDELSLLQRTVGQEDQSLEVMWDSNQFLEVSYKDLEDQTARLDLQRKELLQAVAEESQVLKAKERENAELRSKLQRMRREQASALAEQREQARREHQFRAMQGGVDGRGEDGGARRGHSWASALIGGSEHGRQGGAPSQGGKPATAPHTVLDREGV